MSFQLGTLCLNARELLLNRPIVALFGSEGATEQRNRRIYNLLSRARIHHLRDLVDRTEKAIREGVLHHSPDIEGDLAFLRQALAGHDLTFADQGEIGENKE